MKLSLKGDFMKTNNNAIKEVVKLLYEEYSEHDLYTRFPEYAARENIYKAELKELVGSIGQEPPDTSKFENSVFDLLALTEKLSFEDGFRAAIRHMLELKNFASEQCQ